MAIIGFGCAGYCTAKSLRQSGYSGCITVYSDCDHAPSNPMLTTYYLSGRISREEQYVFGSLEEICSDLALTWRGGTAVRRVDASSGRIFLADGSEERFSKLAVCTGAAPYVPSIPGADGENVYYLRTPADAERLRAAAESSAVRSAVVAGASMAGIKVVEALVKQGLDCTLVNRSAGPFSAAALPETAAILAGHIAEAGIRQKYGKSIAALHPRGKGVHVIFSDGEEQDTDIVVFCLGTVSALSFMDPEQVPMDRGILVDEHMQSGAANIYAAGDCAQGMELLSGQRRLISLWASAAAQGKTAGRNMAGAVSDYPGSVAHNITHFLDLDFFSCGDNRAEGEHIAVHGEDCFAEAIVQDGKLLCVNTLNDPLVSGVVKQYFIKQRLNPDAVLTPAAAAALLSLGKNKNLYQRLVCSND